MPLRDHSSSHSHLLHKSTSPHSMHTHCVVTILVVITWRATSTHMVPEVLRSQEKSWKVRENGEGQGKSGNFIRVARKKEYYSVQCLHFSLKI